MTRYLFEVQQQPGVPLEDVIKEIEDLSPVGISAMFSVADEQNRDPRQGKIIVITENMVRKAKVVALFDKIWRLPSVGPMKGPLEIGRYRGVIPPWPIGVTEESR